MVSIPATHGGGREDEDRRHARDPALSEGSRPRGTALRRALRPTGRQRPQGLRLTGLADGSLRSDASAKIAIPSGRHRSGVSSSWFRAPRRSPTNSLWKLECPTPSPITRPPDRQPHEVRDPQALTL